MLEHQKIVLSGVKDDIRLFKKELYKSSKWLKPVEQSQLKEWVYKNFSLLHKTIAEEVFCKVHEYAM